MIASEFRNIIIDVGGRGRRPKLFPEARQLLAGWSNAKYYFGEIQRPSIIV